MPNRPETTEALPIGARIEGVVKDGLVTFPGLPEGAVIHTPTTDPNPAEYTAFERRLAEGMNKEAYAPHEESWAKDKWPVFLPHARAAIRALIDMGVCLS